MKERKLGILGKKLGMTRIFDEKGRALGVTVIEVGPCIVLGKRELARDGYRALLLGFDPRRSDKVNRAEAGQLKAAGGLDSARRYQVELRVGAATLDAYAVGQTLSLADLAWASGQLIDVTGISKGKGFQGVMRRHNFGGFRATHGTHEYFRHGGSIGCRKWPGRVFKNRKMPGQMGNVRVTTQNLEVVATRPEDHVLLVLGSVPGAKGSYLTLRPAIKRHPLAA